MPGGASLHNCMTAHGPDAESWRNARKAELKPHKIENTMAFMFESRFAMRLTRYAVESAELQHDYSKAGRDWRNIFQGIKPQVGRALAPFAGKSGSRYEQTS